MSMQYVRDRYKVPAKRGGRIRFNGRVLATITSAKDGYIFARTDNGQMLTLHPTFDVEYLEEA